MKNLNILYEGIEDFSTYLYTNCFELSNDCLVRIYSAIGTMEESIEIAQDIKKVLPNAKIIGSSSSGIIFNGRQYEDKTLVVIDAFNKTDVLIHTHTFQDKDAEVVAKEVTESIKGMSVPLMHVLCGNHYHDVHNFIEAFNGYNHTTRLVGGVAGDILSNNTRSFVFTENGVVDQGIVTAALVSKELVVFNDVNIAHTPISTCYHITKTEGSYILEIENIPATKWCKEQFGTEELVEYTGWQIIAENDALVRFPLMLEGHGGSSRFIKYDETQQKISLYESKLNDYTAFRIGYTNPTACVQECFQICNDIMETPVESLFCYSCLFRKMYLGNCADWEMRPFQNYRVCGVFMMGEIANIKGRNEFLNGSCCFVGTAEEEVFIKPNFNVFEDLYRIKDDNKKMLSYVLQKQSTTMSLENKALLDQLMQRQLKDKERLFIDEHIELANSIKFSEDNQLHHFDKMCMIQMDNAELLIAKIGISAYHQVVRNFVKQMQEHLKTLNLFDDIFCYSLNTTTLFFVANEAISDALFMNAVDSLYHKFRVIILSDGKEVLINRFVIVLRKEDLLTNGLLTLQNSKNLQTHFLLCDDTEQFMDAQDEMAMLHILNYAIEHEKVIPYFQALRENETGELTNYEALMRIQDENGTIYAPGMFMNIAKKYHMYSSLSKLMIMKVFELFKQRKELVSINLSAFDINMDIMQQFIFEQLKNTDGANNFVFEILEDEDFRDMERLKKFIKDVRKFGVRIAIDDFGSGYSNFLEMAKIDPDYIKIDINIVRNLDRDKNNQKILETIVFLGHQLNAKLVAEGVENQEIQERVNSVGIHYSQGYHFSIPKPFEELGLMKSNSDYMQS